MNAATVILIMLAIAGLLVSLLILELLYWVYIAPIQEVRAAQKGLKFDAQKRMFLDPKTGDWFY